MASIFRFLTIKSAKEIYVHAVAVEYGYEHERSIDWNTGEVLVEEEVPVKSGICIVAAAIVQNGKVWSVPAPGRHCDVIQHMNNCGVELTADLEAQGFLTSNGVFLTRTEAKQTAIESGQLKTNNPILKELFSEDLW
jgi:hypothetical protein